MRIIWALLVLTAVGTSSMADSWRTAGRTEWPRGTLEGLEVGQDGFVRLGSFAGTNLALGRSVRTEKGTRSGFLTDGKTASEWTFFDDPQVLGRTLSLDLLRDYPINQVRILPGPNASAANPEAFLKGYRLELAPDGRPDDWLTVAEQLVNLQPVIDTTVDGTWRQQDDGAPRPVSGRYLRLTVIREDPPNLASIAELQIFGTGFQARGEYLSAIRDFGRPVILGTVAWEAEVPAGSRLTVQVRTSEDNRQWPEWDAVPVRESGIYGIAQAGIPARYAQFRIVAENAVSDLTPVLEAVTVETSTRLVVTQAQGRVQPLQAPVGVPVLLTYVADVALGSSDLGIDAIYLSCPGSVHGLRVNGRELTAMEYRVRQATESPVQAPPLAVHLSPAARLMRSSRLELSFLTTFYAGSTPLTMVIADSTETFFQQVVPVHEDSVLVEVGEVLRDLVPPASIRVLPPVVHPGHGGEIQFAIGKVEGAVPVNVAIYDLSGRCLRRLLEREWLHAGEARLWWDGRDQHGRPLVPGLYLCRIEVEAEIPAIACRVLGVAY